jgi:hypothetical protein
MSDKTDLWNRILLGVIALGAAYFGQFEIAIPAGAAIFGVHAVPKDYKKVVTILLAILAAIVLVFLLIAAFGIWLLWKVLR